VIKVKFGRLIAMKKFGHLISEFFLFLVGLFLFIDGFFQHRIKYNYPSDIAWLDPYINHGWIGLFFMIVVLGVWALSLKR